MSPEVFFRLRPQMGKEAWRFLINDPAGLGCPSPEGPGCALWYRWQEQVTEPELSI